jgi:HPt (histidine-containing phosphotransfer) domain-containing protein
MSNISQFMAQFSGGARPSLFSVTCPFPAGIGDGSTTEKLSFSAKNTQIPGIDTGLIEVPYKGRFLKIAGDRQFQEITLQIVNDQDWKVRTAFERWAHMINGHSENVGATRLSEYAVDMLIEQFDRAGNVIAAYTLIGAFPTSLSSIDLGFDAIDQIEEFSVVIQYQWTSRPEAGIV